MANLLLRLSLATLTFLFFFYSTTLLTSYFFIRWIGRPSHSDPVGLSFDEGCTASPSLFLKPACSRVFLVYSGSMWIPQTKKKGTVAMKPAHFILSGIVVLALFTSEAAAQIQPWNTIIRFNRFQVLSQFRNPAVFDQETGLVWEQSPDTSTQDWPNAQAHCNTKTVGDRQGWRLPTLQELDSLVEPAVRFGPTLPANPFTNVRSSIYWSATAAASNAALAWFVNFDNAQVANGSKTDQHFVWCVRGGQGVDAQ
jgi:Protein of unknown function (DUF1566)